MTLHKSGLHEHGPDLVRIAGADAVALVEQLTAESWALAGREVPSYPRSRIPCRFVPRRLT